MECYKCKEKFSPPDWWWDEIEQSKKYDCKGLICPNCGYENNLSYYR